MANVGDDDLKISIIVAASISCAFSGYVILSYLAFKDFHDKVFLKFVFYISCADFCMNLTTFIGFPSDGSVLCWLQGYISQILLTNIYIYIYIHSIYEG